MSIGHKEYVLYGACVSGYETKLTIIIIYEAKIIFHIDRKVLSGYSSAFNLVVVNDYYKDECLFDYFLHCTDI